MWQIFAALWAWSTLWGNFLPELTKPLRDLEKNDASWTWEAPQRKAFMDIKKELSSDTVLGQYSPARETMVSADASSYGLGGVLTQKQLDDSWRPVVFISRSLSEAESRYAQIQKEALSVTWACERLCGYVYGLDNTHRPQAPHHTPQVKGIG